jgi:hypothetical protein
MNPTLDEVQELTLSKEPETVSASDVVDFNTRQDETLARLTAEKMGTAPPEKPKEAEPEPKSEAKPEETGTNRKQPEETGKPASEKEASKPLTKEDVERLVEERVAVRLAQKQTPAEKKEDPRPKLSDEQFATHEDWEEADAAWLKRQLDGAKTSLKDELQTEYEESARQDAELTQKRTAWEEAEKEAAIKIPNYAAIKAEAATMPFHEGALKFILDQGKLGPHFVKYFVENKGEWDDIVKMSPEDMRVELRVIGRELKRGASAVTAAPTPVKKVSSAREPLQTVSGQQAPTQEGEGEDFNARQNRVLAEMRRNRLGQFQTN